MARVTDALKGPYLHTTVVDRATSELYLKDLGLVCVIKVCNSNTDVIT